MRSNFLNKALGLGALVALLSISVLAQSVQIEGTVKVKAADGTLKPVEGAFVDIHRTDIKGRWDVKTDKKGHYIRLGMPVQGTFTVIVTGPAMAPTWLTGVRLIGGNPIDFVAEPGEGNTLTPDQIQSIVSKSKPTGPPGGGPGGGGAVSAADKKRAEDQEKEYQAKKAEAEGMQASFNAALERYKVGVEMMKTNNYQGALSEFEAASNVDTTKHEAFSEVAYKSNANMAEAHYQLGVDLFNQRKRDEAKVHFQKAVEAITKSITILSAQPPEKNPTLNADLIVYYNIRAKNSMLLIEHFAAVDIIPDTIKMIEKAEALDATNKNKWAVYRGDVYRFSGMSAEAIAAYKAAIAADANNIDALYGLGLTLIAAQAHEKEKIQEGANALADFVSKAPATDKRVPDIKAALEAVKEAYKVEAEKPATRGRRRP